MNPNMQSAQLQSHQGEPVTSCVWLDRFHYSNPSSEFMRKCNLKSNFKVLFNNVLKHFTLVLLYNIPTGLRQFKGQFHPQLTSNFREFNHFVIVGEVGQSLKSNIAWKKYQILQLMRLGIWKTQGLKLSLCRTVFFFVW